MPRSRSRWAPSGEWLFQRHFKRPAALRRELARLTTTVDERHIQLLALLRRWHMMVMVTTGSGKNKGSKNGLFSAPPQANSDYYGSGRGVLYRNTAKLAH